MDGFFWNQSVWTAIRKISRLKLPDCRGLCRQGDIDDVFNDCESELERVGAPEKEIDLRLYALAQYCEHSKNQDFLKSAVFARFAHTLDFPHFRRTMRMLFGKDDCAVIVFWVVFRCVFRNIVPRSYYEAVEKKLKLKSYELAMKRKQGLLGVE